MRYYLSSHLWFDAFIIYRPVDSWLHSLLWLDLVPDLRTWSTFYAWRNRTGCYSQFNGHIVNRCSQGILKTWAWIKLDLCTHKRAPTSGVNLSVKTIITIKMFWWIQKITFKNIYIRFSILHALMNTVRKPIYFHSVKVQVHPFLW